jgi:hypothetical protein
MVYFVNAFAKTCEFHQILRAAVVMQSMAVIYIVGSRWRRLYNSVVL